MNKIFFITGPTAAGKDTVMNLLMNKLDPKKYKRVIRYTSRPTRDNPNDYYRYMNHKQIIAGYFKTPKDIIEYEQYSIVDRYNCTETKVAYGTSPHDIHLDHYNYIIIAANNVYNAFRSYYGEDKVELIHITASAKTRLLRSLERVNDSINTSIYEICRRIYEDSKKYEDYTEPKYNVWINEADTKIEDLVEEIYNYIIHFENL